MENAIHRFNELFGQMGLSVTTDESRHETS